MLLAGQACSSSAWYSAGSISSRMAFRDNGDHAAAAAAWRVAKGAMWHVAGLAASNAARDSVWYSTGEAAMEAYLEANLNNFENYTRNELLNAAWCASKQAGRYVFESNFDSAVKYAVQEHYGELTSDRAANITPERKMRMIYRTAELAASIELLKNTKTCFQAVFTKLDEHLPLTEILTMFDSAANWQAYESRYFSLIREANALHFVNPWLNEIKRIVDEIPAD
jgi:hypothetical protein